jgi:hypothetical protein
MPHHRANPLVPHLLTVRVTFNYDEMYLSCQYALVLQCWVDLEKNCELQLPPICAVEAKEVVVGAVVVLVEESSIRRAAGTLLITFRSQRLYMAKMTIGNSARTAC